MLPWSACIAIIGGSSLFGLAIFATIGALSAYLRSKPYL